MTIKIEQSVTAIRGNGGLAVGYTKNGAPIIGIGSGINAADLEKIKRIATASGEWIMLLTPMVPIAEDE